MIDIRVPTAILICLAHPLTTYFLAYGFSSFNRLLKDEFKSYHSLKFWYDATTSGFCIGILATWAIVLLNLMTSFITQEEPEYIGAFVLILPLLMKGIRCVHRMNEYTIRIEKRYGQKFR